MRTSSEDSRPAPTDIGAAPSQMECGRPVVTDGEWAVALVREVAAAFFASTMSSRPDGRGFAGAIPDRPRLADGRGRASPLDYPTVR